MSTDPKEGAPYQGGDAPSPQSEQVQTNDVVPGVEIPHGPGPENYGSGDMITQQPAVGAPNQEPADTTPASEPENQ